MTTSALRAPFPWFGGKSRAAHLVWAALGDVRTYVEPFAGSLAVLLARPTAPRVETVNDLDCYLANFWRAAAADPDAVARFANWPVNEADLSARHQWLVDQATFRERMKVEPDFFDAKIAGWWVWGLSTWIGSGWCDSKKWRNNDAGNGVHRKLPHLGDAGRGVNRQLPHLGSAGMGVHGQGAALTEWISALSDRLRRVRVACGGWTRVLGPSVLRAGGKPCGVFLDPPYSIGNMSYATQSAVSGDVREWAIAHGDDPALRIVLCGYDVEHEMPPTWTCVPWKAHGGYGSQASNAARENKHRERLWLSPHCLPVEAQTELEAV